MYESLVLQAPILLRACPLLIQSEPVKIDTYKHEPIINQAVGIHQEVL